MSRAEEYRKQAAECRKIARSMMPGKYQDQLLKMAESWERMADDAATEFGRPKPTPRNDDSENNEPGQ